ncbi:MAG: hypothetical protein RR140_00130 [Clostridia bacterium]
MKKYLSFAVLFLCLITSTIFFNACYEDKKHSVTLPINEEVYSISYLKSAEQTSSNNVVMVNENNGYAFAFTFKEKYNDISNVTLKINGKAVSCNKNAGVITISADKLTENIIITMEGIQVKKLSLEFSPASYFQKGEDASTAKSSQKHMDNILLKFLKPDGSTFEGTMLELLNAKLQLNYAFDTELVIKIKSSLPKIFESFGVLLNTDENNFSGKFEIDGNSIFPQGTNVIIWPITDENYDYIVENGYNLFKIKIDKDIKIYFNNLALFYQKYASSKKIFDNETFDIVVTTETYNDGCFFDFSTPLNVNVVKKIAGTKALDNAIIVINGREMKEGPLVTKTNGTITYNGESKETIVFTLAGKHFTPASLGTGSETNYCIDIKNVEIPKNAICLKIMPNERIKEYYSYGNAETKKIVYTDNSIYYDNATLNKIIVLCYIDNIFDYENMIAKVDVDGTITSYNLKENPANFQKYNGHYDFNFDIASNIASTAKNITVSFENIVDKKINFKIINNFENEVKISTAVNLKTDPESLLVPITGFKDIKGLTYKSVLTLTIEAKDGMMNIENYFLCIKEPNSTKNLYADLQYCISTVSSGKNINVTDLKKHTFKMSMSYSDLEITLVKNRYATQIAAVDGTGKRLYKTGEDLDLSGLKIKISYIDERNGYPLMAEEISLFDTTTFEIFHIYPFDKNQVGQKHFSIKHKDSGICIIRFSVQYV